MENEKGLSGPHVSAAFLCERILIEKDGVPSFIHVAERFMVPQFVVPPQLPPGIQLPQSVVQTNLVIQLKAGGLGGGKYSIQIKGHSPHGEADAGESAISVF